MMAASRHLASISARRRSGGRHRRASRRGGGEPAQRRRRDSARHYLSEAGQAAAAIELLKQAVATEPNLDALNALGSPTRATAAAPRRYRRSA